MPELTLPHARSLMSAPRPVLRPEMDILDAIDELIRFNQAAAPVVEADNTLLGMLTEKDCLRVLSSVAFDGHPAGATVAAYQSKVKWICEPAMDLFRVAELFLENNFPVLPVQENGKLIGVISRSAVLRGIQKIGQEIEAQQKRFAESGGGSVRPSSIESMQRLFADRSPQQVVEILRR